MGPGRGLWNHSSCVVLLSVGSACPNPHPASGPCISWHFSEMLLRGSTSWGIPKAPLQVPECFIPSAPRQSQSGAGQVLGKVQVCCCVWSCGLSWSWSRARASPSCRNHVLVCVEWGTGTCTRPHAHRRLGCCVPSLEFL